SCVFNKAIRKYGKESFLIEQVDTARTQEELDKKEIYWIKTLKTHVSQNGYNLEWGGNGRGKVSEETKQKISKAHKGRTLTEDWKKKISKSRQGQKVTEVTKKKISDTLLGHKVKLETR